MKIYGVSQSSGAERVLYMESGPDGLVLLIKDLDGNKERARILVDAGALLPAVTDPAAGGAEVGGISPGRGRTTSLRVEVRRNEVWLTAAQGRTWLWGWTTSRTPWKAPSTAAERR